MRQQKGKYVLGLAIAFVGVIIVGRLAYYNVDRRLPEQTSNSVNSDTLPTAADSAKTNQSSSTEIKRSAATSSVSVSAGTSISACIEAMNADIAKNGTQYEKGSILVRFAQEVTFEQAVQILATHGATPKPDNRSSFESNRVVTAFVQDGTEVSKVCTIKRDQSVKYAGLNAFFDLHE